MHMLWGEGTLQGEVSPPCRDMLPLWPDWAHPDNVRTARCEPQPQSGTCQIDEQARGANVCDASPTAAANANEHVGATEEPKDAVQECKQAVSGEGQTLREVQTSAPGGGDAEDLLPKVHDVVCTTG